MYSLEPLQALMLNPTESVARSQKKLVGWADRTEARHDAQVTEEHGGTPESTAMIMLDKDGKEVDMSNVGKVKIWIYRRWSGMTMRVDYKPEWDAKESYLRSWLTRSYMKPDYFVSFEYFGD